MLVGIFVSPGEEDSDDGGDYDGDDDMDLWRDVSYIIS